ncbi:hypothetical protein K491DRAFT_493186 [Lophiostoma macrostomum CBS 122681]|uniref:Uncharacterized protein n=1 Tax=Lophiostoma macrostomum CBS 122681 TaxID=1314788 RepID=A0A6A6T614_9PLEO|nr:hypothetical protein K491DRAFT_493186 [Lophiostoma macrostomum CBS 122681]
MTLLDLLTKEYRHTAFAFVVEKMDSRIWDGFGVSIAAAAVVDKLALSRDDTWALASSLGSTGRPILFSVLWTVPQLGSSQFLAQRVPLGKSGIEGVIIGDGHRLSFVNPVLTEWIFARHTIPSGSCLFATVTLRREHAKRKHEIAPEKLLQSFGLPFTVLMCLFFYATTTHATPIIMFYGGLYASTLTLNVYLALQTAGFWAGFTGDAELSRLLILAPNDAWTVLSGPRDAIKIVTTGSHVGNLPSRIPGLGQFILVLLILSTALLRDATWKDGLILLVALFATHLFSYKRAASLSTSPTIRRVGLTENCIKAYQRRAELISALSASQNSDTWAYDSGLLTRKYRPPKDKDRQAFD